MRDGVLPMPSARLLFLHRDSRPACRHTLRLQGLVRVLRPVSSSTIGSNADNPSLYPPFLQLDSSDTFCCGVFSGNGWTDCPKVALPERSPELCPSSTNMSWTQETKTRVAWVQFWSLSTVRCLSLSLFTPPASLCRLSVATERRRAQQRETCVAKKTDSMR